MLKLKKSFALVSLLFGLNAISSNIQELESVKVVSSTINDDKKQSKNISSVSVLTSEDIEKINPRSVADLLNKIPGVTYSSVSTDSIKVHIRGIDNQNYMGEKPGVAIVIDGVPVQETSGKINIDLDNIESIKVIKGGASYLYGNDALAGAVVITTKKPKAESQSKIEGELGSFSSKRLVMETSQVFDNSNLQFQVNSRNSDGYWEDTFVRSKGVNGKYQYYIDDLSDITFGLDYSEIKTGDGNTVHGITQARLNPKSIGEYSYSGYYNTNLTKAFTTYSKSFSDDSNLTLRLHSYKDDKDYVTGRNTKDKFEIWDQKGAKAEYSKIFGYFSIMLGIDFQKNNTDETSYDKLDGKDPKGKKDGDLLEKYDTKETVKAIYTEINHQTTEKLTTTLNFRYDDISHEYKDKLDSKNNVDPKYKTYSYRLGGNYSFNDNFSLYSGISTGFRTPTVTQISQNQTSLAQDPTLNIPSEIKEEKTYNYEIGLRGTDGFLTYDTSIFQINRKDYIGRIAGNYITSDDDEESNYDNIGDMRSRGFEFAVSSDPSKPVSFNLAYTYLQSKFTDYTISQQQTIDPDGPYKPKKAIYERVDLSGNYVSRTPRHVVNLSLDFKAFNDKLVISPEMDYKGSYYADEANQFKQGGFTVFNLNILYKYNKSLELFGRIDNVLDKNYFQFVNVNSSALATMEDATIRVAAPRAYYAGLRYKF